MAARACRLAAQLVLATLALQSLAVTEVALPQRDLIVELREAVADGAATGWDLNSADVARDRVVQNLRVRNGRSASLRLAVTRPVLSWQALPGVWGARAAPATEWITAGRALVVQPTWPGGARPVAVSLQAQSARFDAAVAPGSAEPPQRGEAQLATLVSAPLGTWITLAASGAADGAGNVVDSRNSSAGRRVLQLRVSLAP
jgi:hypothetical protein